MAKTTARGLAKLTAASNRAFAKASPAKKRVMIAQDVLAALKARRLKARAGMYLVGDLAGKKGELRDILPTVPPCSVCAKGAIMLCTVMRRDRVKVNDVFGYYDHFDERTENRRSAFKGRKMSRLLGGVFSPSQLAMIENEFEGRHYDESDPRAPGPLGYGLPETSGRRLVAIMENIVKNGGTFVPGVSPR